jgi:hypothetical protein
LIAINKSEVRAHHNFADAGEATLGAGVDAFLARLEPEPGFV